MAFEIERKFLLTGEDWRGLAKGEYYCQGYLCANKERTVRVRIAADQAWLTIKGASSGASRLEFEYPLPLEDARTLLDKLAQKPLVEKIRYRIPYEGFMWEVDEFLGLNKGLFLAEVELSHEEQIFAKPSWVGNEVTEDPRYYNACLARHPYSTWVPA